MKTNVKMLRSSFKWFLAILLCLGFCFTPVKANTTDYSIEDFHIDATYHKNNTITQTETIQVNYSTPKHGIYQYIPLHFYVGYKDGALVNYDIFEALNMEKTLDFDMVEVAHETSI